MSIPTSETPIINEFPNWKFSGSNFTGSRCRRAGCAETNTTMIHVHNYGDTFACKAHVRELVGDLFVPGHSWFG